MGCNCGQPQKPFGLIDAAKAVLSNEGFATEELIQRRLAVCDKCPRFFSLSRQCKECGCFVDLKTKFTAATCPIFRW